MLGIITQHSTVRKKENPFIHPQDSLIGFYFLAVLDEGIILHSCLSCCMACLELTEMNYTVIDSLLSFCTVF